MGMMEGKLLQVSEESRRALRAGSMRFQAAMCNGQPLNVATLGSRTGTLRCCSAGPSVTRARQDPSRVGTGGLHGTPVTL